VLRQWILPACTVVLGAALVAASFNLFLIPRQILSGGLSGISMIIGYFTGWNIAFLYLLSNLPVIIWGLLQIGRKFILLSVISVIFTSWFMHLIPESAAAQNDILAAVTGGVLIGVGTGISLRAGGSTGGFDIIGSIVTQKRDFPLGTSLFILNGLVILALGYYKNNWDLALNSMLSIYITSKVVDMIYTKHLKVTVFIVTRHKDSLVQRLMKVHRGVTVVNIEGAYTKQQQHMLMTVTTRYELIELRNMIRAADPQAFVNIVETIGIMGRFRRG